MITSYFSRERWRTWGQNRAMPTDPAKPTGDHIPVVPSGGKTSNIQHPTSNIEVGETANSARPEGKRKLEIFCNRDEWAWLIGGARLKGLGVAEFWWWAMKQGFRIAVREAAEKNQKVPQWAAAKIQQWNEEEANEKAKKLG